MVGKGKEEKKHQQHEHLGLIHGNSIDIEEQTMHMSYKTFTFYH